MKKNRDFRPHRPGCAGHPLWPEDARREGHCGRGARCPLLGPAGGSATAESAISTMSRRSRASRLTWSSWPSRLRCWRASICLPTTTKPSSNPWPPPSSPTECPVCGRMSSPGAPPRWSSLQVSSAVWPKSTGCPLRPTISSMRRSGRSRSITINKETPCTAFILPATARRSGTRRIRSAA